jgi:hypothetical protein
MLCSALLGLSCAAALVLAPLGALAQGYTLTVTPSGGSLTGVSAVGADGQVVATGQAQTNGTYLISVPSPGPFTLVGAGSQSGGTTVGAVYFGATVSQSTYSSSVTMPMPAVPPTEVTSPASIALTAGASATVAVSVYNGTYGVPSDGALVALTPSAGLDLTPAGPGEAAVGASVYAGTVAGVVYADLTAPVPGTYDLTVSAPPGGTLAGGVIPVTVAAAPCTGCTGSGAPPPASSTSPPVTGVGSTYSYDGVSGTVVLSATFDPTTAQDLTSQDGAITLIVPADALASSGTASLEVVEFSGLGAIQLLGAGSTAPYEHPFGPLFLILATADGGTVSHLAKPLTARFNLAAAPAGTDDALVDVMQVVSGGAPAFVGGAFTGSALQASLPALASSPYALMEVDRVFPDVPSGFWAYGDITLMASKFVLLGYPDGQFGPQDDVTRAEFTAMLLRMMGIPIDPQATPTFTDVPSSAWYYGVVATAEERGIVQGVSSTSFEPDAPITREQIVTIFVRAAEAQGWLQSSSAAAGIQTMDAQFADASQVDAYAQDDMGVAVAAGLVKGITPTTLAPLALSTRAQAAAWTARLWRMFVA